MDEEKQSPEELDENLNKPPDAPADDASVSAESEEVKMPEMDMSQSESKKEPAELPPENTSQDSEASASPDWNENDAEAEMLKMLEKSESDAESVPESSEPEEQPIIDKPSFNQLEANGKGNEQNINMLFDVTLPISIELGRTQMAIEDILNLGPGSIVELDKLAGEPVDLLVNDKLLAKGEVVVIDENFGVRITNMISPQDRIRSLK